MMPHQPPTPAAVGIGRYAWWSRASGFVIIGAALSSFGFIAQATSTTPVAPAKPTIIYASSTGAKLDSDVRTGGGHDDTAPLQAALDQARSGSLELIMDGPALVSGLTLHSHWPCLDLVDSVGVTHESCFS